MTGMKCKPIYTAPEVLQSNEYTKKGDVYSFAFIVYEIITGEKPFCEIENMNDVLEKIINENKRPVLKESIPMSYKKLIERCWSQEQSERPTFEEIVYFLEMDSGFITDKIDNENYQKYIKFIGEQTMSNKISNQLKIQENVEEENKDQNVLFHKKQAELGNVESQKFLAKKYSLENDCENMNKYFNMLIKQGKCEIPIEYAVNLYKEKHYEQAFKYFCSINKANHPIAQFFIAVMKYWGNGCKKNQNESYKILKYLSDNGIERATEFLENHFEKV